MRWWGRPGSWVLLVAVGYGLSQLLLLDVGRFLTWDEAVYVSEVSPFAEAVGMGAHRSRGITLVVAPVVMLTDSMPALRVYLAVVSSAALFCSFVVWCRTIGWAAPVAAALFASSWLTVFYGPAVYPNLYAAFLAVAVIGLAVRFADSPTLPRLSLVAVLVAVAALVRPLEALILIACLVVVGLATVRRNTPALAAAGLAGFGLGALAWVIEAWIRFEGPFQRLMTARELIGGGFRINVSEYLRLLDPTADLAVRSVIWLGVLLVLGLVGVASGDRSARRVSLISLIAAALLAVPYLFGAEAAASRFMLPAFAMLCVASGLGLTALASRLVSRPAVVAGLAVVMLLITSWNLPSVLAVSSQQNGNTETALVLGETIRDRSQGESCFFLSPANHPAISVASGCRGSILSETTDENRRRAESAQSAGSDVFVVTNREDPGVVLADGWRCESVEPLAHRDWKLCTFVPQ